MELSPQFLLVSLLLVYRFATYFCILILCPAALPCLLRNLYVGQEATEPDVEQQTGSKLGKEYDKAGYLHLAYLTYMQRTLYDLLGWMNHKLESILLGEISTTSNMQVKPL